MGRGRRGGDGGEAIGVTGVERRRSVSHDQPGAVHPGCGGGQFEGPIDAFGRVIPEIDPDLQIVPMHADFTRPIALPDLGDGRRVGFFTG